MGSREHIRPDPEALLRQVEIDEEHERCGRLKVFLGYAPRVGKSRRMFDEGMRRKSRGQDVVIGAVQAKGSEELACYISALEVIPLKPIDGGQVMDTEAIVGRRPEVCLIDQLAYDNPPGFAPPSRWQQVQTLLQGGIAVVTAVNLQHICEQQDRIEQITGKRSANAIPEAFLRSADEIVVVDVPADELTSIDRETDSTRAEQARKLEELREMALFLSADVVENQLQRYLERAGIHQSWGTQERVLVCITPRSNAKAMIDSGRRNAERSHGQLLAVYVQQGELNREASERLQENLDYARKAGAEVHTIKGTEPIASIIDFARSQRITQVFIGHTQQRRWTPWVRTPVDKLIEEAEGMDVRIFPQ